MTPRYADATVTLYAGDCLDVLAKLPDASVDAVVTDPPYGLGFMGREWDALPPGRPWAEQCLRVLKPGGHLLAFGGTRTSHRLACAIEDAGFEIRDSIAWLYGSGFPKSLDVSKAIDKAAPRAGLFVGFAAHFCERRTASGLTQKDIAKHFPSKTGGLTGCVWNWENGANVPTLTQWAVLAPMLGLSDEWLPLIERVEAERAVVGSGKSGAATVAFARNEASVYDITAPATPAAERWQGWGTALKPAHEPIVVARKPLVGTVAANVLAHGTGALNVDACRIATSEGDRVQYGTTRSVGSGKSEGWRRPWMDDVADVNRRQSAAVDRANTAGRWPANVVLDESQAAALDEQSGELVGKVGMTQYGSGTNQVYGTFERSEQSTVNDGLTDRGGASRFFYIAKADASERVRVNGTAHPTVKPIALMRWLVRLVTPPGGTVLEPFAGSGTTVEACILEGFRCIAIERDETYLPLIRQRIHRRRDPVEAVKATGDDGGLFDLLGEVGA